MRKSFLRTPTSVTFFLGRKKFPTLFSHSVEFTSYIVSFHEFLYWVLSIVSLKILHQFRAQFWVKIRYSERYRYIEMLSKFSITIRQAKVEKRDRDPDKGLFLYVGQIGNRCLKLTNYSLILNSQ